MPVRKIPLNYCSVTGAVSHIRNNQLIKFESTLERDFYEILSFDLNVLSVEEQPVCIEYKDENGKDRHYTPDVLVIYRDDIVPAMDMVPLLCEVKYHRDLLRNWLKYKPKIRAATKYAKQQGWEFKIMTEQEIRTPYLKNVKFLRHYRELPENHTHKKLLLSAIHELRETDPETLLLSIFQDKWNRAQLIPTLWRLISVREIGADLTQPLTMQSRIWCFDPVV